MTRVELIVALDALTDLFHSSDGDFQSEVLRLIKLCEMKLKEVKSGER